MRKLLRILSAGAILLSPLLVSAPAFAASVTMSLSPATGEVAKGNILTVKIYENSGSEQVNAAQANLSYPANLLSYVNVSPSPAFSVVATTSGGGGRVDIARGALPAVSGNQLVASVEFKALGGSGTANIELTSGSQVISAKSNSNILNATSGGSYSLKATPGSGQPQPLAITGVTVSNVGSKSATVSWTTSEPASSEVDYGMNTKYGLSIENDKQVTAHKIVLDSSLLLSNKQYHFVVRSLDASGSSVISSDHTFTTSVQNLELIVSVVDQNHKPVPNTKVAIENTSGVTDQNGKVTLKNLKVGKTVATVTYRGRQTTSPITIMQTGTGGVPQTIILTIHKSSSHIVWIIILILVLLALIGWFAHRSGRIKKPDLKKDNKEQLNGL